MFMKYFVKYIVSGYIYFVVHYVFASLCIIDIIRLCIIKTAFNQDVDSCNKGSENKETRTYFVFYQIKLGINVSDYT